MKSISTLALTLPVTLSLALTGAFVEAPASAQRKKAQTPPAATSSSGRKFNISTAARTPISNLQKAVVAKDAAAIAAALPVAQAAATNTDEKYIVGQLQLQNALDTQNLAAQQTALEALVQSGGASADELPKLYTNIGILAYNAKDYQKAGAAYERLIELEPSNIDNLINLGELRNRQGRTAEGIQLIDRAIAARTASGQPVPEDWYKRAVSLAYSAKNMPQAFKLTRDWLTAYPTDKNWRDALSDHQSLVRLDNAGELDRLRLMRAAKALHGERAYAEYAETAFTAGLPGEAKAVLDEGIAASVVDRNKLTYKELLQRSSASAAKDRPTLAGLEKNASTAANGKLASGTADAYLSYGDYAKAAGLYRTALAKGGVDANVVNTRLGIALAMSGDKVGANAAFNAVTGPRQDLARYWILWLSRRA